MSFQTYANTIHNPKPIKLNQPNTLQDWVDTREHVARIQTLLDAYPEADQHELECVLDEAIPALKDLMYVVSNQPNKPNKSNLRDNLHDEAIRIITEYHNESLHQGQEVIKSDIDFTNVINDLILFINCKTY